MNLINKVQVVYSDCLQSYYNFVNGLFSFKVYIKCGIIKYIKVKGS